MSAATVPGVTQDWRMRARCRNEPDPDLFFPDASETDQIKSAKAICARCAVREACLAWALETGQDTGIWGGLSQEERRRRRRKRPVVA